MESGLPSQSGAISCLAYAATCILRQRAGVTASSVDKANLAQDHPSSSDAAGADDRQSGSRSDEREAQIPTEHKAIEQACPCASERAKTITYLVQATGCILRLRDRYGTSECRTDGDLVSRCSELERNNETLEKHIARLKYEIGEYANVSDAHAEVVSVKKENVQLKTENRRLQEEVDEHDNEMEVIETNLRKMCVM